MVANETMLSIVLSSILVFAVKTSVCQNTKIPPSFTFESYAKSAGLNQSSTNAIYQDHEDIVWVGNFGGANSFDGYEFQSYINEFGDSTTLSDDVVWTFEEDDQNNLWLGTKNGLNLYNRKTQTFKNFTPVDRATSLAIKSLKNIGNGLLLIGTEGEGLFTFDTKKYHFEYIDQIPKSKITSIDESSSSFWIGTENQGLFEIDKSTYKSTSHLERGSLKLKFIRSIHVDSEQVVWVGTDNDGLFIKNSDSATFLHSSKVLTTHSFGNRIQTIKSDNKNRIWIGSATNGLTIYDKTDALCYHFKHKPGSSRSIADNDISSIHIGENSVVYIGYYQKGFDKMVETPFHVIEHDPTDAKSLSHNNVYSLLHDSEGRFWAGTYGGGLNLFQQANPAKFKHFKHDPLDPTSISHNWIRYIYEDSRKRIWIGTWGGGLNLYDEKDQSFKHFVNDPANPTSLSMNTVESIFEDSKGDIWIATYGEGINIYQPQSDDFRHIKHDPNNINSLSDDHITAFYEDAQGYIWISTYGGGLNRFNRIGDFDHYLPDPTNPKSLNDFKVLFIFDEKDEDFFWLTTLGGGLNKVFPKTGEFIHYTMSDGLPNNTTIGMLKTSQDTYWISTNNGLSHFYPENERFVNYSSNDGLGSDDFNLAGFSEDSAGFFYFGGKQGITYFHPDEVAATTSFPKLSITTVSANNNRLNKYEDIEIPFDQRLNIHFAAINPTYVKKIKYAYQFNKDTTWFDLGSDRTLEFVSLEPGDHVVKIRSTNTAGIWNPDHLEFSFYVIPPWYRTTIFQLISLLVIISTIIGIIRFRSKNLYKQKVVLKKLVNERTKTIAKKNEDLQTAYNKQKELEQFKESMVGMIAHDLKNPLVSIIRRASGEKSSDLDQIHHSSQHMLNLIENMLGTLRFENSKIQINSNHFPIAKIIDDVIKDLKPIANENGVRLVNTLRQEYIIDADEQLIHRVLNNLISNAIKYSDFDSQVEIKAMELTDEIKISVQDYGEGIPGKDLKKIFESFQQSEARSFGGAASTGLGLTFCKLAINAHKQKLEVESEVGKGTVFSFNLPKVSTGDEIVTSQIDIDSPITFKETEREMWLEFYEKMKGLQIYEAGKWSELADLIIKDNAHNQSIYEFIMNIVTKHDVKGLSTFKRQLATFLTKTT